MKNKIILPILVFAVLLAACGGEKTATAVAVAAAESTGGNVTPDPCSESALTDEVGKVNDLMREFDDYSRLASSTPQGQLIQVIPPMQEVRRRAESQKVPVCLVELKKLQLAHMNTVIETLMVFMSDPKAEDVNRGITQSRGLHMSYDLEIARLLGLTVVAPVTSAAPVSTVDPNAATTPSAQNNPDSLSVLNPGPNDVTLLAEPNDSAGGVATLTAGAVATAFGRTANGDWIQVEVPGQAGQKAWVSASLVQVSGEPPIVTP